MLDFLWNTDYVCNELIMNEIRIEFNEVDHCFNCMPGLRLLHFVYLA